MNNLKGSGKMLLKNSIRRILPLMIGMMIYLFVTGCKSKKKRPNIIWINAEDMSCHFGYNGEEAVNTPYVDRLAQEGVVFNNAYVTCPVCSPSRSALITGMYQTTIGAHNHRSSGEGAEIYLPDHIKTIPEIFQEAGYYTCNVKKDLHWGDRGKTDYNFEYQYNEMYDGNDWTNRKKDQPFFAQIQLKGGKARHSDFKADVDVSGMQLPPYYPKDSVILDDWKNYLKTVMKTDYEVGKVIERLKKYDLLENTIVFFTTDHGISHVRGKQFLFDEGTKVPFIIWGPKYVEAGMRDELMAHIDMAATSLYFAGIEIPDYMEARTLYGPEAEPREYVVSARDRCDETEDRIRSVRKGKFKYIRNFYPERPYLQPNVYKDYKDVIQRMRWLYAHDKLNAVQSLIMAEKRPEEELYDLSKDPFEIRNLANDPDYKQKLLELRKILDEWIDETDDKGQYREPWEEYLLNMKSQNASLKSRGKDQKVADRKRNMELMKKWREKGI
jgi:arylsulfatase A-like enzyme